MVVSCESEAKKILLQIFVESLFSNLKEYSVILTTYFYVMNQKI